MNSDKTKSIIYTALFAALVCVATFIIKVPSVVTNGYVHLGDGFIFISVILLGKKNGALAGAIGASLADMLGGYSHYIIPTFIIKLIMAYLMGTIIEKLPSKKSSHLIGASIGSVWQILAYYVVGSIFVGSFITTLMDIPGNFMQSLIGIVIALLFSEQLKKIIK